MEDKEIKIHRRVIRMIFDISHHSNSEKRQVSAESASIYDNELRERQKKKEKKNEVYINIYI